MAASIIPPHGFYVYLHRRATTGEVFYVGKGHGDRAWSRNSRSPHWRNIVKRDGLIVEIVESGLQEWYAFELEVELITYYGRKDLGYGPLVNGTDGGEGKTGAIASAEWRAQASERLTRRWADPEARAQKSKEMKQLMADPKVRAQVSEQMKQRMADPEARAQKSKEMKQRMADPKVRAQVSEQMKKYSALPEVRAKRSKITKERMASPETRAKVSEQMKQRWANPKARDKVIASLKRRLASPESRAKKSEIGKQRWADPNIVSNLIPGRPKVLVICSNGVVFESIKAAENWCRVNGYIKASGSNISNCCKGKNKTAYGYTWRYAEKETGAEAPVPSAV